MEVNLRPADYVGRRVFYLPRFLKLFLVVSYLLALVVLPVGQLLLNEQLKVETLALSATLESGRAEAERIRAALNDGRRLSVQVKRLEEQLALRYRWSLILQELDQAAAASAITLSGFFWRQELAELHAASRNLRTAGRWPEAVEKTDSFAEARLQAIEKEGDGFLVLLTAKIDPNPSFAAMPEKPPVQHIPQNETQLPAEKEPEPALPVTGQDPEVPLVPGPEEYIVQRTDSLIRIAGKFGVTLEELLAANPQIKNPRLIIPGQRINLPAED
jgi:LysM repeat protein